MQMSSFNKVILMGNMTRDPDLKYTQGGTGLAEFGLAVNRKYQGKDETCFIDVTAFGKQAEHVAQYCHKGKSVLVDGRLDFQTWEKDGRKHSKHKVIANSVTFISSGGPTGERPTEQGSEYDERF
jgi:single-strand DNA-binding protein